MDRLLSCECGQVHRVSRSQAGQEIKCGCGRILPVPTLRALSNLPLAEPESPVSDAATTRGASAASGSWQGWRGTTLAFAMAGFLIASIFCGWFSLQRWLVDTSYSVDQEIEAGEAMIDKFDPNTLASVWYTFGQMGMRNKQYPPFYLAQLYAAERVQFAQIAGGIALGFAAIGLILWLTNKKPAVEQ
jgi:hypothetical protein